MPIRTPVRMSEVVRRESWFLRNTSASRFTVKSEAAAAPINIIRQMRSAARGACRSVKYVTYASTIPSSQTMPSCSARYEAASRR